MLPNSVISSTVQIESNQPSKTYKLDTEHNRLVGFTDNLDAIKQAIYLMLSVERYEYLIYSWNYGFETYDLFGKDIQYVMSEVKQRIIDTLTQDERVLRVDDFDFQMNKRNLLVTFTAHTIYGDVDESTEVVINGL